MVFFAIVPSAYPLSVHESAHRCTLPQCTPPCCYQARPVAPLGREIVHRNRSQQIIAGRRLSLTKRTVCRRSGTQCFFFFYFLPGHTPYDTVCPKNWSEHWRDLIFVSAAVILFCFVTLSAERGIILCVVCVPRAH